MRRPLQFHFGKAADAYDAHAHVQHEVRGHAVTLGRTYFPSGALVVDLGAGTGLFGYETRDLWRTVSLDLALPMSRVAAGRGQMALVGSAEGLPFADDTFEGVFSSLMIQWIPGEGRAGVFSEIARVLRPGGTAIVTTLTTGTLAELHRALSAVGRESHLLGFTDAGTVGNEAQAAGLRVQHSEQFQIVQRAESALEVMRSLKSIGAIHHGPSSHQGLMTPRQLQAIEAAYPPPPHRSPHSPTVQATWNVLLLALGKQD